MIDLHIQSIHGDGDMSIYRLLETIKENNISYFSILDKNNCFSYKLIDRSEYPKLIPGVKLYTTFNQTIISLIGYDVDPDLINEWFESTFTMEKIKEIEMKKADRLVQILENEGYPLELDNLRYDRLGNSVNEVHKCLIEQYLDFKHQEVRDFMSYGVNNVKSKFYLDLTDIYFSLDESIDLIRRCGGKVFLAHPFEYRSDIPELLEMVIDKNLDGVEVFHSSTSVLNSLKLIEFCKVTHKLASLGSGFVGNEELVPMGVHIDDDLLELDCFKWIFERES